MRSSGFGTAEEAKVDEQSLMIVLAASLVAFTIALLAMLQGWRGWLDLKRTQLERDPAHHRAPASGTRIELAGLKERVRRLEAIADGSD